MSADRLPRIPDRSRPVATHVPPRLLATRIAGSRYVIHDLAPGAEARWTFALAGREECAPDYRVDRDSYPYYLVELVAAGRGWARFGDGPQVPISRGSVYAYAPTTVCHLCSEPADPLVKFFFALTGRDASDRLRLAFRRWGSVHQLSAPAGILSVAEDAIREGQRETPNARAICLKLIEILLLKVAEDRRATRSADERARETFLRCKEVIDEQAQKLPSLEHLARLTRLDPSSICRLFRRYQGTSPYQYLLRRKMVLAAEFLIDTGARVSEAADHVGFTDPFHFARCFKAVHGVPPSAVRQCRTG